MFKNSIEQRGSSYNTKEYLQINSELSSCEVTEIIILEVAHNCQLWNITRTEKGENVDSLKSGKRKTIQTAILLQKLIKPKMQVPKGQIMLLHRYL